MLGSEFATYVRRILKRTDKDTEIYEAATDIIADIRIQLKADDYKEEAYITGISTLGEYRIALPSDFGHIIGEVTLIDDVSKNDKTLKKISKQEYDAKYSDRLYANLSDVTDDIPEHFCIYAGQIYLGPVPDKTSYKYQINYTTEDFAEVTSATDPVPFTDKYRNTLRAGVLAEIFAGLEQYDESNYWREIYNSGLVKLIANDEDNTSDREGVVYHGI